MALWRNDKISVLSGASCAAAPFSSSWYLSPSSSPVSLLSLAEAVCLLRVGAKMPSFARKRSSTRRIARRSKLPLLCRWLRIWRVAPRVPAFKWSNGGGSYLAQSFGLLAHRMSRGQVKARRIPELRRGFRPGAKVPSTARRRRLHGFGYRLRFGMVDFALGRSNRFKAKRCKLCSGAFFFVVSVIVFFFTMPRLVKKKTR